MYLKHFGLNEFPFTLTPNLHFFCNLAAYREALNVIMVSLHNGEGFVKITGEVGTGKTLLCRKLLDVLDDDYKTAYISNPTLDTFNLQKAIARELEIPFAQDIDNHGLLTLLNEKLIELHNKNKHVVVIVDEAHVLSDEALEGLRLLSNLETGSSKLIQIVLVGQPELDRRLKKPHLRQLRHRIVFSYRLPMMRNRELLSYVCFRLATAGYSYTYDTLFSPSAIKLLLKVSRGIPRLINILCHKALLISYGYGKKKVDMTDMKMAISDTESVATVISQSRYEVLRLGVAILSLGIVGVGCFFILRLLRI